jgi:serine/threonine protein kinase
MDYFGTVLSSAQGTDELGRFARFRVLEVLGSGGLGLVFRAEDTRRRQPVALKVLRPELVEDAGAREQFARAARAMAACEDVHVVKVYEVGEEGGLPFFVMEHLAGESLKERLGPRDPRPNAQILRIGRAVAGALARFHAREVAHGNLKPGNIWLEPDHGRVKLLDLGMAAADGPPAAAPVFDPRPDVQALGRILYQLCSGGLLDPKEADPPGSPGLDQLNPYLPLALSQLVTRMVRAGADESPVTAAEAHRILYQLLRREVASKRFRHLPFVTRRTPPAPAVPNGAGPAGPSGKTAPPAPAARGAEAKTRPVLRVCRGLLGRWPIALALAGFLTLAALWGWGLAFPQGRLLVHVEDATDPVSLADKIDQVYLYDPRHDRTFPIRLGMQTLPVGTYEWRMPDDVVDLRLCPGDVTLERGATFRVTAWVQGKVSDSWAADVASRPVEEQGAAVTQKLRERNPGFYDSEPPVIRDGKVVELELLTDRVSDISPLQAFVRLQRLSCAGSRAGTGALCTLGPLQELALTRLNCANNPRIVDLTPLRGMQLSTLDCSATGVRDLAPLRGMPLESLHCQGTAVRDFTPLNSLPLEELYVDVEAGKALEVLRGHKALKRINGKPAADFWKEMGGR